MRQEVTQQLRFWTAKPLQAVPKAGKEGQQDTPPQNVPVRHKGYSRRKGYFFSGETAATGAAVTLLQGKSTIMKETSVCKGVSLSVSEKER